jgi:hypothetical protein
MADAACSRVEEYKRYALRDYPEMTVGAAGIIQGFLIPS